MIGEPPSDAGAAHLRLMPPLPALAESNVGGPGAVGLPTVVVVVPAVVAAAVRVPDATPAPAAANTTSATPSVARLINLKLRAWQSAVNAPGRRRALPRPRLSGAARRPGQPAGKGRGWAHAVASKGSTRCGGGCLGARHLRGCDCSAGGGRVRSRLLQERQRTLCTQPGELSSRRNGAVRRSQLQLLRARVRHLLASRRRGALDPPPVASNRPATGGCYAGPRAESARSPRMPSHAGS